MSQIPTDFSALTALDFEFHLAVSIASGNLAYPLILNSFKNVYTHFTGTFFRQPHEDMVRNEVLGFHLLLVEAIETHEQVRAADVMHQLLVHGENHLKSTL